MKRSVRIAVLAIATGIASAAPAAAEQFSHITGNVVDASTGTPVAHAAIHIADTSGTAGTTYTDGHGAYAAVGMFEGVVTIDVTSDRYEPAQTSCAFAEGDAPRISFRVRLRQRRHWTTLSRLPTPKPSVLPCAVEPSTIDRYNLR